MQPSHRAEQSIAVPGTHVCWYLKKSSGYAGGFPGTTVRLTWSKLEEVALTMFLKPITVTVDRYCASAGKKG